MKYLIFKFFEKKCLKHNHKWKFLRRICEYQELSPKDVYIIKCAKCFKIKRFEE